MNKTPNTDTFVHFARKSNRQSFRLLKFISMMKGMLDSDIFLRFSNLHEEKLPIIYANIRV